MCSLGIKTLIRHLPAQAFSNSRRESASSICPDKLKLCVNLKTNPQREKVTRAIHLSKYGQNPNDMQPVKKKFHSKGKWLIIPLNICLSLGQRSQSLDLKTVILTAIAHDHTHRRLARDTPKKITTQLLKDKVINERERVGMFK